MNRSRGFAVVDNGRSLAATRLSRTFVDVRAEQRQNLSMSRAHARLPKLIFSGLVGAFAGALLIPYAYSVQGGEPGEFAVVGMVTGAAVAVAYAYGCLRLSLVGAACGSIAALSLFQVPVCDGSHVGLPLVGAAIGFLTFGLLDRFISAMVASRQAARCSAVERVESTNQEMHASCGSGVS